jgi:hypothetical protein
MKRRSPAPASIALFTGPPPDHKQLLSSLVRELDNRVHEQVSLTELVKLFHMKPRRLHDFINVMSAIGGCRKSGFDQIIWFGNKQIPGFIRDLKQAREIDNARLTLCELFPESACIGAVNLTVSLLLLFHALRTDHLDLRVASRVFSRQPNRCRSTLSKLYQIATALDVMGISQRTLQVFDVVLLDPYVDFQVVPPELQEVSGPLPIDSLLNHKNEYPDCEFVYSRRKEMHELYVTSLACKFKRMHDHGE